MELSIASIVNKELKYNDVFVDENLFYKIMKQLEEWHKKSFIFSVLADKNNHNSVYLIAQSKYIDNYSTLIFKANNANKDASLSETIKQFKEFVNNQENAPKCIDNKYIKINEWWRVFLENLYRQEQQNKIQSTRRY